MCFLFEVKFVSLLSAKYNEPYKYTLLFEAIYNWLLHKNNKKKIFYLNITEESETKFNPISLFVRITLHIIHKL